jgi:L-2-hydroxycarboxylate dehydrogenase (NAD+)
MVQGNNSVLIDVAQLEAFIGAMLRRADLPDAGAATVARLMAEADLQGSDGHGVIRLPQYLKRIQAGGINIRPNIRVVTERAAMAVVDGDNAMWAIWSCPMPPSSRSRRLALRHG